MKFKGLFGVMLILGGVYFAAASFGLTERLGLDPQMVFSAFIVLVGLMLLAMSRSIIFGSIVLFFGAMGLLDNWFPQVDKLTFPGILVIVGIELLFGGLARRKDILVRDGLVNTIAVFGGVDKRLDQPDFHGGSVLALFGEVKLDLTGIGLLEDAVLEVNAILGSVELHLPQGVVIRSEVNAILGGVENRHLQDPSGRGPALILRGNAFLGGIEIH